VHTEEVNWLHMRVWSFVLFVFYICMYMYHLYLGTCLYIFTSDISDFVGKRAVASHKKTCGLISHPALFQRSPAATNTGTAPRCKRGSSKQTQARHLPSTVFSTGPGRVRRAEKEKKIKKKRDSAPNAVSGFGFEQEDPPVLSVLTTQK